MPIHAVQPDETLSHHWDYLYEPDAKDVVDALMTRYIESLVYQGVVENIACEMRARMVAMKSASDNAGDLIDELQLVSTRRVRLRLPKKFQRSSAERRLSDKTHKKTDQF